MAGVQGRSARRFGGAGTLKRKDGAERPGTGERERLRSLAGFRVLDTGPEREFDGIARLAARVAGAEGAAVTVLDGDRETVKAAFGVDLARPMSLNGVPVDGDPQTPLVDGDVIT